MAVDDFEGELVALGYWLYAGEVRMTVEVVAYDCDFYFDRITADDGRSPWVRTPLNSDGLLYYVRADGNDPIGLRPFASIEDAKAWVNAQTWGPVVWKD